MTPSKFLGSKPVDLFYYFHVSSRFLFDCFVFFSDVSPVSLGFSRVLFDVS